MPTNRGQTKLCVACPTSTYSIPLLALSGEHAQIVSSNAKLAAAIAVRPTKDGAEALNLLKRKQVNAAFATEEAWKRITENVDPSLSDECGRLCEIASGKTYAKYFDTTNLDDVDTIKRTLTRGRGIVVCRKGTNHHELAESCCKDSEAQIFLSDGNGNDDQLIGRVSRAIREKENLPAFILGLPGWVRDVSDAIRDNISDEMTPCDAIGTFGTMKYQMFLRHSAREKSDVETLRMLLKYLFVFEGSPKELVRLGRSLTDEMRNQIAADSETSQLNYLIEELDIKVKVRCLEPKLTLDLWEFEIGEAN